MRFNLSLNHVPTGDKLLVVPDHLLTSIAQLRQLVVEHLGQHDMTAQTRFRLQWQDEDHEQIDLDSSHDLAELLLEFDGSEAQDEVVQLHVIVHYAGPNLSQLSSGSSAVVQETPTPEVSASSLAPLPAERLLRKTTARVPRNVSFQEETSELGRQEFESAWFQSQSHAPHLTATQDPAARIRSLPSLTDGSSYDSHSQDTDAYAPRSSYSQPPSSDLSSASSSPRQPRPPPSAISSAASRPRICCGCQNSMPDLRYVCSACGPLMPRFLCSDDEEQNGTEVSFPTSGTRQYAGKQRESRSQHDFIHSKVTNPYHKSASVSHSRRDRLAKLRLSAQDLLPAGVGDDPDTNADSVNGDDLEAEGFELCSECVETEGVKHAHVMLHQASRRSRTEADEEGLELNHSFIEMIKSAKSIGWIEVEFEDVVDCTLCGQANLRTNRFKCESPLS